MKIAFVVSTFPKLSETFIINQVTGLLDLGYDVQIFAEYLNKKEHKVHPDVEKYLLMERIRYFTAPENKFVRVLKALRLIAIGIFVSPLHILKTINIFKYGRKALSLRMLYILIPFLGKRFDITHFHFGPNGAQGIHLKGMGYLGKIITSFHGYDANTVPGIAGRRFYNALFEECDLFTANTNFTKEQVVRLGCDDKKIEILPVGLNIEKFEFLERKPEAGRPVRILTVGRLVEKKGHQYAIRAVARLAGRKDIVYLIAGDGPLRGELESLVSELDAWGSVKFLHEVDEDEVIGLYRGCHIFLLPCVTAANGDREGQALVLQEAQATGMPVISTYHNGIPEGIADGISGFLVPEKDIDALAERIEFLVDHPELWPEMGKAGRRFVGDKYNIKKLNGRLAGIYEKMAGEKA